MASNSLNNSAVLCMLSANLWSRASSASGETHSASPEDLIRCPKYSASPLESSQCKPRRQSRSSKQASCCTWVSLSASRNVAITASANRRFIGPEPFMMRCSRTAFAELDRPFDAYGPMRPVAHDVAQDKPRRIQRLSLHNLRIVTCLQKSQPLILIAGGSHKA